MRLYSTNDGIKTVNDVYWHVFNKSTSYMESNYAWQISH